MEIYRIRNDTLNMTAKPKHARKAVSIILDSNALFVPLQFKIDIFEELRMLLGVKSEPVLLSPIKKELETIAGKGSPKMRKWASYALKLAEKCAVWEVEEKIAGSPDDAIVWAAERWACPVFTNDRKLRKRLRNINVPVIYVRQKVRLEIDGRIANSV
jgi:rRNA-processing protein FCF1